MTANKVKQRAMTKKVARKNRVTPTLVTPLKFTQFLHHTRPRRRRRWCIVYYCWCSRSNWSNEVELSCTILLHSAVVFYSNALGHITRLQLHVVCLVLKCAVFSILATQNVWTFETTPYYMGYFCNGNGCSHRNFKCSTISPLSIPINWKTLKVTIVVG